ncbi:hypothetical protein HYPSUDRAFT_201457 [Hypholoma sublateritium FD-334 SS-4]|uniref:Uncharacterized protein n=1 Tax=Hypholoma sublateritium (strain FD-334 SS-4) TaxID=945553 RepID=A0A0D2MIF6_HYPSF|nr:hypothetical protein HYPSUDRAFT_201457 [Hypholoma sublateritium FD-334 SS-4]
MAPSGGSRTGAETHVSGGADLPSRAREADTYGSIHLAVLNMDLRGIPCARRRYSADRVSSTIPILQAFGERRARAHEAAFGTAPVAGTSALHTPPRPQNIPPLLAPTTHTS